MASDQELPADISDAHHEGFGAGVAWADQTPDTGAGAQAVIKRELWARLDEVMRPAGAMHELEIGPTTLGDWLGDRVYAALVEAGLDAGQSLTEAKASHQAEIGRQRERNSWLTAELADERIRARAYRAERDTLTARLAEAEAERDREDGLRAFAEGWAAEHAKAEHEAKARIAELEHTITQYLDSHGTAGTGVLGKGLKAAVGRVE